MDDVAMAAAVSTVAPATVEGTAHFRDGFHHCGGSVGRHGSLDHSVAFGTFSSGSSPGWIRLRGLTFAPWAEFAPWVVSAPWPALVWVSSRRRGCRQASARRCLSRAKPEPWR